MTGMQTIIGPPDGAARSGDGADAVCTSTVASAPSALEKAQAIRDGLHGKLDAARQSLDALDEERKSLAFAAHTEGGEAERTLTAFNKRRQLAVSDIEMLEEAAADARAAILKRLGKLIETRIEYMISLAIYCTRRADLL